MPSRREPPRAAPPRRAPRGPGAAAPRARIRRCACASRSRTGSRLAPRRAAPAPRRKGCRPSSESSALQLLSELLLGVVYACAHRALGRVDDVGHLAGAALLDLAEHERDALIEGQLVERPGERLGQPGPSGAALGVALRDLRR